MATEQPRPRSPRVVLAALAIVAVSGTFGSMGLVRSRGSGGGAGSAGSADLAVPGVGGIAQAMAATATEDSHVADPPRERRLRQRMVEQQIRSRGVTSPQVLAAMAQVPRHLFVPEGERGHAYEDHPLPIGGGQTISQPYIVALMTALLGLPPQSRVLEIGTGSGYQAAVLSRLAAQVYSVEIVAELGARARETLSRLGYENVQVRIADGYRGWPEAAPFDGILLTAAPHAVPPPLIAQLKPGGRMVLPIGGFDQDLIVLTKQPDGTVKEEKVLPVRFVPMTGEAEGRP
ncbi:MAG TPA: protein-L-isoaspartate(D-aspartate) O-methyltransferase [Thermoanaerobaculia bacterium]|nr:protein-L-isoaspartate(D-aspartate) O-methyltransferase [Thermoanaerobaculia bacterium]